MEKQAPRQRKGRPPLPVTQRLSCVVDGAITVPERDALRQRADAAGQSLSATVRDAIRAYLAGGAL